MKCFIRLACAVSVLSTLLAVSTSVFAWDVTAKVVNIEASYMPDNLRFKLDAAAGTCAAGSWVYYSGTNYSPSDPKKNLQAIYAALLVAAISGKKVEVHGDTNCLAINIHSTNQ